LEKAGDQPQDICVTDKNQQCISYKYFEKKLRPSTSFDEINSAVNKKYNSDDPEDYMLKPILVKYFTCCIHITNVKTLFAIGTYLHKMLKLHDERML
jgi:hypothetical protein